LDGSFPTINLCDQQKGLKLLKEVKGKGKCYERGPPSVTLRQI